MVLFFNFALLWYIWLVFAAFKLWTDKWDDVIQGWPIEWKKMALIYALIPLVIYVMVFVSWLKKRKQTRIDRINNLYTELSGL